MENEGWRFGPHSILPPSFFILRYREERQMKIVGIIPARGGSSNCPITKMMNVMIGRIAKIDIEEDDILT